MSKLDRFLLSESLVRECSTFSAISLKRYLSDHRPILLRDLVHDYGPTPFRFFHYWLEVDGFEAFVKQVWQELQVDTPYAMINFMNKLKHLKNKIREWNGDIVSDVQTAFVKDRQILDGPFILNELIQWCKVKKKHSFLFKIDFEKAYDSVRWDYLDDILKKFGFGEK
ncbi:RNA-directed DNA polymerase, eukaryota [Tanacetum coccineum]